MKDNVYIVVKVGDKPAPVNKPYMSLKEGSIVSIIDELEWDDTIDNILSDHMKKVFAIVKIDRSILPTVKTYLPEIGVTGGNEEERIIDIPNYRQRTKLIELNKLATVAKDATLESKWKSKDVVEIADCKDLKETDFIESSTKSNEAEVLDANVITSGSYTVGSGGDYSTWTAALSDIGNLTGNLTLTQIASTFESATAGMSFDLNGYNFTMTVNRYHQGNNLGGHLTYVNTTSGIFLYVDMDGGGNFYCNSLNLKQNASNTGTNICRFLQSTNTYNIYWGNNIIDCNSLTNAYLNDNSNAVTYFYANITFGYPNSGFFFNAANSNSRYENNTFYGGSRGIDLSSKNTRLRNNAAYNTSTDDFQDNSAATGFTNASEDTTADNANWTTGSGNITSVASTNWFDIYKIDANSDLYNAGSTSEISAFTHYINGVPKIDGNMDIGAWGVERSTVVLLSNNF